MFLVQGEDEKSVNCLYIRTSCCIFPHHMWRILHKWWWFLTSFSCSRGGWEKCIVYTQEHLAIFFLTLCGELCIDKWWFQTFVSCSRGGWEKCIVYIQEHLAEFFLTLCGEFCIANDGSKHFFLFQRKMRKVYCLYWFYWPYSKF